MNVLTPNALNILKTRYLQRNEKGELVETPEQLFRRVAKAVASAEKTPELQDKYEQVFFDLMTNLKFLPNTPTLLNAGREGKHSVLSACFVLPVPDSLEGIFDAVYRSAILHQSGAGTGYSFSRLRPEGSTVSRKTGVSSGPVSFMKVFNAAVEEIKQGNTRRGALMMILNADHPDIFKFVSCKMDEAQIRNANISVAASDAFMEAVQANSDWVLSHPSNTEKRKIKAKDLWEKIVDCAWSKGDPGLFFIDQANRHNPVPHVYKIESTNPCGEVPLGPNEACNLGSIVLSKFVNLSTKTIEWEQLGKAVHDCVRFLDNVIDISRFPFTEIDQMVKGNRKIGLGVMSFHDVLLLLGINYDSEVALELGEKLACFIQTEAKKASVSLGAEKGSFLNFKGSIYEGKVPTLRNCTRTVIAPTGTISLIAGEVSSGIEPVFAFDHKSNRMDTQMEHIHWVAREWKVNNPGKILPTYFKEAWQIEPEWHIKMQAAWQKFTDDAVSKTINLPNSATREDVSKAYMLGWKLQLKGLTIFRDGCRSTGQVLVHTSAPKVEPVKAFGEDSRYYELKTGSGELHVNIAHREGKPYRLFTNMPPIGTEISGLVTVLGITISKYLELGGNLENLIKHYQSVVSDKPLGFGPERVLSIPHALAITFKHFLKQVQGKDVKVVTGQGSKSCPECHSLNYSLQEGCCLCLDCGYSACS